jgi:hypothetical protein
MKQIAWLLVTIFCLAVFVSAGEKNNSMDMTGWVCNAKCVDQTSGKATCNKNCSESAGQVVFIDNKGQVLQISNQEMAQPMAGKKCHMKGKMDPNTGAIAVQNIEEYAGP